MYQIPCRVSADLRKHEAAIEASDKRYKRIAAQYDTADIAAEVCQRFPDAVTELISLAIESGNPAAILLANAALDLAVTERMTQVEH